MPEKTISRPGLGFVISAPSGSGKTTLCRRVMQQLGGIAFSISHTTRAPRGTEQEGVDYYFVADQEFDHMIVAGEFLEWAHVHKHRYGTAVAEARRQLSLGFDLLFDIDVQGARQIQKLMPEVKLIFIAPPSLKVLSERLRARAVDSEAQVEGRLHAAAGELRSAKYFDYLIVNEDLERASDELRSIVIAGRSAAVDKASIVTSILHA